MQRISCLLCIVHKQTHTHTHVHTHLCTQWAYTKTRVFKYSHWHESHLSIWEVIRPHDLLIVHFRGQYMGLYRGLHNYVHADRCKYDRCTVHFVLSFIFMLPARTLLAMFPVPCWSRPGDVGLFIWGLLLIDSRNTMVHWSRLFQGYSEEQACFHAPHS